MAEELSKDEEERLFLVDNNITKTIRHEGYTNGLVTFIIFGLTIPFFVANAYGFFPGHFVIIVISPMIISALMGVISWIKDRILVTKRENIKSNNTVIKSKYKINTNDASVRSEGEIKIFKYICNKYSKLKIISNDRTLIPSRTHKRQYLEVDIYIPEISFAIECNGEFGHNHEQYDIDCEEKTEVSDEKYKENYCKKKGILLVHVGDSTEIEDIFNYLSNIIDERLRL